MGLLAAFCAACGGGSGSDTVFVTARSDVDGTWTLAVEELPCSVLPGLLRTADGDETFVVAQDGKTVTANFVDGAGNHVTLAGTLDGKRLTGTFDVRAPSIPNLPVSWDRPLCTGKAYVPARERDRVWVLDMRTGALLRFIALAPGSMPGRPCATPDGTRAFVPLPGVDGVAVIDVKFDEVIDTLFGTEDHGLDAPEACVVSRDGATLYIASKNGLVTAYDTLSLRVLGEFQLAGGDPRAVAIDADGRLYVLHGASSTLDVLDTRSGVLVRSGVPTSAAPASLALAGDRLVVAAAGGLDLFTLPGLGRTTAPVPGVDVAITPDRTHAYVTRADGRGFATAVDLATGAATATFETGSDDARGIAICNDGGLALVSFGEGFPTAILDLTNDTLFDFTTVRGEFILLLEGDEPADDGRRIVATIEGHLDGVTITGSYRITTDTSPLADFCPDLTKRFVATLRD